MWPVSVSLVFLYLRQLFFSVFFFQFKVILRVANLKVILRLEFPESTSPNCYSKISFYFLLFEIREANLSKHKESYLKYHGVSPLLIFSLFAQRRKQQ